MKFLEFLGIKKAMEDTDPKNVVKLPVDYVKPVSPPQPKEYYRVGFTDDHQTTLTLINHEGWGSMTLTMNQEACEQLIRMLRSTYQTEVEDDHA